MNITVSVQVREPTEGELRAQALLKEATSKHDSKDLTGAIACLRDAYGLLEQSPLSYPVATYLRLPLYLQKAGRFEEAMESFAILMKGVAARLPANSRIRTELSNLA